MDPLETITPADRELWQAAARKRKAGQRPTVREQQAHTKVQAALDRAACWRYLRRILKAEWCTLVADDPRRINRVATQLGIPCLGNHLDAQAAIQHLWRLVRDNAERLAGGSDEDPLLAGASQELKDRYVAQQIEHLAEKTALARLDRRQRESQLLSLDVIHAQHVRMAARIREAGETLQRHFGAEAYKILDDALTDFEREAESLLQADDEREPFDVAEPADGQPRDRLAGPQQPAPAPPHDP
jgi:hypothetical protein